MDNICRTIILWAFKQLLHIFDPRQVEACFNRTTMCHPAKSTDQVNKLLEQSRLLLELTDVRSLEPLNILINGGFSNADLVVLNPLILLRLRMLRIALFQCFDHRDCN